MTKYIVIPAEAGIQHNTGPRDLWKTPTIPRLCESYGFRQYMQADTNTGFAAAGVDREDRWDPQQTSFSEVS